MSNTLLLKELNSDNALELPKKLVKLDTSSVVTIKAELKWVQPFGLLVTSKAIRDYRNKNNDTEFLLEYNPKLNAHTYAAHMGFYKAISPTLDIGKLPGQATGSNSYMPITELNLRELHKKELENGNYIEMGDVIEKESSRLSKILSNNNIELHKLLTYIIREILRNIPEHSDSDKAWICGQRWNDGNAEIAIVDDGIGIMQSLIKNHIHKNYVENDQDALEWALKPGISKSFSPKTGNKSQDVWSNSGFGLFMVSQICIKLGGSFNLVSGSKYVKIDETGRVSIGETDIQGTAIKINLFESKLITSSKELIAEVAKNGEQRAKSIKTAFKTASMPSKGLIEKI